MEKYNFKHLFNEELKGIKIPIIQRDYAQGRESETRIRNRFLDVLYKAVVEPENHITLDFVYGEIEDDGMLIPLDGQQRITTLFLLHWYAAKREKIDENEYDFLKRFTYETRVSARLFCEKLIAFLPDFSSNKSISEQIKDQPWYPLDWDNDPTVCSMLTMLDCIQIKFKTAGNIWKALTEEDAITFYFIALDDMGLTDDIYIKMNSRGKPLTPFEHFKAEFDRIINDSVISHKIDVEWTDLLWPYKETETCIIDNKFMRYFHFISDIICYRNGEKLLSDDFELANQLYNQKENVKYLEKCFDCWSKIDIDAFFNRFLSNDCYETGKVKVYDFPTNLLLDCFNFYTELNGSGRREFALNKTLLLYAFLVYRLHPEIEESDFRRRIRIIRNLIWNSPDEIRPERMLVLLQETEEIILSGIIKTEGDLGYNKLQKAEEIQKLEWGKTHQEYLEELFHLEDHSLLYGCIAVMGLENYSKFEGFRNLFNIKNFDLISQALLCFGDYGQLLRWRYQIGSKNYSGWQALMHPSSQRLGFHERTKEIINQLLQATENSVTEEHLQKIVDGYLQSPNLVKDWRYYFIKYKPIREYSNYGMYYWREFKEAPYEFVIMSTEKSIGGRHWNAFLKVIYETNKTGIALEDYGHPIFIVGTPLEMRCNNTAFEITNAETKEVELYPIPQENGVDIEDRVEFGANIILKYLQA